jgi:hypothetical protein
MLAVPGPNGSARQDTSACLTRFLAVCADATCRKRTRLAGVNQKCCPEIEAFLQSCIISA